MALHGLGFRPSEKKLISFLKCKNYDPQIELNIPTIDLSESNPGEIPDALRESMPFEDENWCFFSRREAFHGKGKQFKRKTRSGSWKSTGKKKEIVDEDCVVTKRYLVHCNKLSDPGEKTDWVIHEYALSNPLPNQEHGFSHNPCVDEGDPSSNDTFISESSEIVYEGINYNNMSKGPLYSPDGHNDNPTSFWFADLEASYEGRSNYIVNPHENLWGTAINSISYDYNQIKPLEIPSFSYDPYGISMDYGGINGDFLGPLV